MILVAFLIVVARMGPWTAKDYLAMTWPSRQEVSIALASLVILLPGLDALAYLVGQPIIPSFVVDVYQSAQSQGSMLLLWLAIVIAAPVAEEIIFRGFIFRGWVRPTQRPMLGILIVTLLFTIIHIQYNWFGLLQVFMIGLLLTWTRWRSGSTLLPMVMHVIANFYAMLQAYAYFRWFVSKLNQPAPAAARRAARAARRHIRRRDGSQVTPRCAAAPSRLRYCRCIAPFR